jgi:acyl-CoA synthetase (NDP forming)
LSQIHLNADPVLMGSDIAVAEQPVSSTDRSNTSAHHRHRLHHLLAPRSIAVLGVSARRRNIGAIVMDNIRAAGFRGPVTGVGRERATVAGQPVVPSLDEVGRADLLVVSVPASQVVGALKEGSALGIRNYAIITAGFAESHQAGAEVQAEIRQLSAADDLAVLGPNTVGFINYRAKVNASFAPWWKLDRPPGDVAVISQSGGTAGAIMVLGAKGGARFGYVVGSGNEAVLDLVDYLDYIGADPRIRTIAIYSEGWRRGRDVVARIAQLREANKLIVVLSAARSVSAARAAVSHTASLATPGDVSRQVLESVGAIVVDTPQDAGAALAMLSSKRPLPHGRRLLVCADAGGSGVLSSDLAEEAGLSVPELPTDTQTELEKYVPAFGSARNPLDPTPVLFANLPQLKEVIRLAASDPCIDALVVASAHNGPGAVRMGRTMAQAASQVEKFSFAVWNAGSDQVAKEYLRLGIPYLNDPRSAFQSLSKILSAQSVDTDGVRRAGVAARAVPAEMAGVNRTASADGSRIALLTEDVLKAWFAQAGIRVIAGRICANADDAVAAARELGFPAVLKSVSPKVPHRARVGAIALSIGDEASVRREYRRIAEAVRSATGDRRPGRMLMQAQAPRGVEAFLGIRVDAGFGPVAAIGIGGPAVEAQPAVAFGLVPAQRSDIEAMISRAPLLRASLDRHQTEQFLDIAVMILRWWTDQAGELGLVELDVNPIMFDAAGAFVTDALAVRRIV